MCGQFQVAPSSFSYSGRSKELRTGLVHLEEKLEGNNAVKHGDNAQLWEQQSSQPTSRPKAQRGWSGSSPAPHHGAPGLAGL